MHAYATFFLFHKKKLAIHYIYIKRFTSSFLYLYYIIHQKLQTHNIPLTSSKYKLSLGSVRWLIPQPFWHSVHLHIIILTSHPLPSQIIYILEVASKPNGLCESVSDKPPWGLPPFHIIISTRYIL